MEKEKITLDDLKKIAISIQKMKEPDLPAGLSWFTKLMARFGWHRKYEILVFNDSQFNIFSFLATPPLTPSGDEIR